MVYKSLRFQFAFEFEIVLSSLVASLLPPSLSSLSLPLSLSVSASLSLSFSDYGYKPADGFDGPCVRDEAVLLDDPCADGQVKRVMKSRGYRKVAGDVCVKGVAGLDFEPYNFTCCSGDGNNPSSNPSSHPSSNPTPGAVITNNNKSLVAGLGVALAIVILIAVLFVGVAAIFVW